VKDFEMTEVPSIEFIGYRIPQHEQNNYILLVLFTRHPSINKSVLGNSGI